MELMARRGHHRCHHSAGPNGCHDGVGPPSTGRSMIDNAPSSATAAITPRHAGPHTALVKKHQSPRIDTLYPADES